MKGKKKKNQKVCKTNSPDTSAVSLREPEMPTAEMVAEERAREAAYERELEQLRRRRADGTDSCSSDSEASLRGELRPLRPAPARAPLAPRAAAALLPPLAAALRPAHDVRFLDDYMLLLKRRTEAEAEAATEELMGTIEEALSADEAAGAGGEGVVLAAWLAAAAAWAAPRAPAAPAALHCLLRRLAAGELAQVARALRAALRPRELLAAGDAARGGPLAPLLLRAALGALLGRAPPGAGELRARQLHAALTAAWPALDAAQRLAALAVAGRALAGATAEDATALLAALAPPPPRDSHDPDYLKVSVAVKTLQNLVKDM